MTTRRELLAAAALTGLLGGCNPSTKPNNASATPGDRLLLAHRDGLGLFDVGTGEWVAKPQAATANGLRLASVDANTLLVRDAQTALVTSEGRLAGSWTPRAVDHDQVALVSGARATIYQPEARTSTQLLVMRNGAERKRFDLPGNLEPEAFSTEGSRLYILDYLPPQAPNVYRVRVLDLTTGVLQPLLTRTKTLVPENAEEVMRGQGRHAVHDANRGILFTLYTHQGDHQHTGELLGVRPGAPNVHSFIHALHLEEGWAFCIDLPAPFGTSGASGHTIALSANGKTLYAISAEHGSVAVIDPEGLAVMQVRSIAKAQGEASALALPDGRLLVGAGKQLTDGTEVWQLDEEVRGLAMAEQLWIGTQGGVTAVRWDERKVVRRLPIDGALGVRQAFARSR